MATSTLTSARRATKAAALDLLKQRPGLLGMQILPSWQKGLENESIYLGATRGAMEPSSIAAGRVRRRDLFHFEIFFVAARPGNDTDEAETRVEEMFAELENLLATDPTLGGVDGLQWALLGNVFGPDTVPADEGVDSTIKAEVNCHVRLA